MAQGGSASDAPGQAPKQGHSSPLFVSDLVGEWLHSVQCWQHSEPAALGPSRVKFEVPSEDPA
jgi:hypothetical protein